MIALTDHEKKVLSIITMAAAIFIYYKFLEGPCINNLKAMNIKLKESSSMLKIVKNSKETIEVMNGRIALMQETCDIIPDSLNISDMLYNVKNIVSQTNCTLGNIAIRDNIYETDEDELEGEDGGSDIAKLKTVGITCSLYGDYANISKVIKSLESSRNKMTIETIDLNSMPETKDYFAVLEINCYYINGKGEYMENRGLYK